jgi:hypothetical protein
MEVYLIPIAPGRHELYCEVQPETDEAGLEHPPGLFRGLWRRLIAQFRTVMVSIDRERHRPEAESCAEAAAAGWRQRARQRGTCWLAERIAEQRLLWHLRRQTDVVAVHPDDLSTQAVHDIVRSTLKRDFDKHRRWLAIDGAGLVVSIPLIPLPGPNLPGLYFSFRVVGHILSLHGARNGLQRVKWHTRASAELTLLRSLATLPAPQREHEVHKVASALSLRHLSTFFNRTALPTA